MEEAMVEATMGVQPAEEEVIRVGLGGLDSTILAQSNGAEIRRRMETFLELPPPGEPREAWIEGDSEKDILVIVIRKLGKSTKAGLKWFAICDALSYGPLDPKDFEERKRKSAIYAIKFVGAPTAYVYAPENWAQQVYDWMMTNKQEMLVGAPHASFGLYPREEDVHEAQKQLGYYAPAE
jgi:hypothetical protein